MLKLVISDDEGKTTVVPLMRDELTIGRKEGNTIRLTERNVSRRHARLAKRGGDYLLEDLASYNGIVLNGARLGDVRPVRHGDQILIGDYKIQIVEDASVQATMQPAPPPPPTEPIVPLLSAPPAPAPTLATPAGGAAPGAPLPAGFESLNNPFAQPVTRVEQVVTGKEIPESIRGLRLVFLAPAGVPAPVMLDKLPMVMGRSEAADIALPFSSISREHARLYLEDGKLMIEDLGSSNGVQVNGEKSRTVELGPGDMVQLGVVEFRVARRGDSTVVIQKVALEEKRAAARNPLLIGGAVLASGAVLGLALFLAFRPPSSQSVGPLPTTPAVPSPSQEPPSGPSAQPTPTPIQPPGSQPPSNLAPPTPTQVVPPAPAVPQAPVVAPQPMAPQNNPEVTPPGPTVAQPLQGPERPGRDRRVRNPPGGTTSDPVRSPPPPPPPSTPNTRVSPPAPPPPPPSAPSGGTGMDAARACIRANTPDSNACVVRALEGHASSEPELGLLGRTYQSMGRRRDAVRVMQRYIREFPTGGRVNGFQSYIDGT